MPILSRPLEYTIPESNEDVQNDVKSKTGIQSCLWQIAVVHHILEQQDVITVAATGSGKSLTYWMALLCIKYGIVLLVTPLKLLGMQFVEILTGNKITAVSMTAANTTHQLFKVRSISTYSKLISKYMDRISPSPSSSSPLPSLSSSLLLSLPSSFPVIPVAISGSSCLNPLSMSICLFCTT